MTEGRYGAWGSAVEAHKAKPKKIRGWIPKVLLVLGVVLAVLFGRWWWHGREVLAGPVPTTRDPVIGVTENGDVPLGSLRRGDCLIDFPTDTVGKAVGVGLCSVNHRSQVVAVVPLAGPLSSAKRQAAEGCGPLLQPFDTGTYGSDAYVPNSGGWDSGFRSAICFVFNPHGDYLRGSALP